MYLARPIRTWVAFIFLFLLCFALVVWPGPSCWLQALVWPSSHAARRALSSASSSSAAAWSSRCALTLAAAAASNNAAAASSSLAASFFINDGDLFFAKTSGLQTVINSQAKLASIIYVDNQLNKKQNILIPGNNITITDNIISSSYSIVNQVSFRAYSSLTMNTASKLGPHTQTDRGTCPGVGL